MFRFRLLALFVACVGLTACQSSTPADDCSATGSCEQQSDCIGSDCTVYGRCVAGADGCYATSASCKASLACKVGGKCSALNDVCTAASDADCQQSQNCTSKSHCTAKNGDCVAGDVCASCSGTSFCSLDRTTCVNPTQTQLDAYCDVPDHLPYRDCCLGYAVPLFCMKGGEAMTLDCAKEGKVCGWSGESGGYECVTGPGSADPSGKMPKSCQP